MAYSPIVAAVLVLYLCCSISVGTPAGTVPEVGHYSVKNKRGQTCFLADLAATFRIRYVKTDNTTATAEYVLPGNCSVAYESTCPNRLDGENQAVLLLHVPWDWDFGLYLRFSRETPVMEHFWLAEAVVYYHQVPSLFPDAKFPNHFFSPFLNNLREMETRSGFFRRRSFLCESGVTIVNLTFPYFDEAPGVHPTADLIFNYIHVQPFDVRNDKFAKAERCPGDHHKSTPSPITTPPAVTSEIPLSNASTIPTVPSNVTLGPASTLGPTNGSYTFQPASSIAPDNHTTPASTTVPFTSTAPPTAPPEPLQGRYVLKNATGDVCLLAYMALQFDITYAKQGHSRHGIGVFNVPTDAATSGFCDKTLSNMTLSFYGGTFDLTLSFQMVDGGKFFHLSSVDLHYVEVPSIFPHTETPNAKKNASNGTLDIFRASSGKSYRCAEDRDIVLTTKVTLHTRQVHVQAFGVSKGQYSTAEDCGTKPSSNELVALVTGGSLCGVIVIVIVTYFVCTRGRRTTRDGYTAIN